MADPDQWQAEEDPVSLLENYELDLAASESRKALYAAAATAARRRLLKRVDQLERRVSELELERERPHA
jgi:hypothetical protein